MANKLSHEFRKYHRNRNHLKHILRETKRVLDNINAENFFHDGCIIDELLPPLTLNRIQHILDNNPAIVVFGQDSKTKAQLINNLLSAEILPVSNGNWRWIKLEYNALQSNYVSLSLGLEYEVVENLKANEKPWTTVPKEDLEVSYLDDPNCPTVVEAKLHQPMLENVSIFVAPNKGAVKTLAKGTLKILPLFVYALGDHLLSDENIEELRDLKETYPYNPILFLPSNLQVLNSLKNGELTESEQHRLQGVKSDVDERKVSEEVAEEPVGKIWLEQLHSLGFLQSNNMSSSQTNWLVGEQYMSLGDTTSSCDKSDILLYFISKNLKVNLVDASNYLNEVHTNGLRKFILSAFDMAREIQITPKRIKYAQKMENELYTNLMKVVSDKQEELTELIQNIIQEMKNEVMNSSSNYQNVPFIDNERTEWNATVRAATSEVQRIVLTRLGERVAQQLVTSVNCLRETFVGTLQRCLLKLEKNYENDASVSASDALKQILSAAYNVELHNSCPSLVHSFLERLRQLFKSLPLPWSPTPTLDATWRRKVTTDVLNSLSSARLARTISVQFKDKVKASHDAFQTALKSLENHISGRLERTEEQRIAIRKLHAPKLAKLALESTSMSDLIRYGMPHISKEIGRGQYGVVFACEGWGGAPRACAVKSVVPPDERHWNDLAMEFYYTRSIPDHTRIVKLRGSVIDHMYGGGFNSGIAVLLITDRMAMDLYCGLHNGLSWLQRIQIAIDVLEGIRYLHSLGLVHRDIKLKNVLLDHDHRAKLTDLGFCITEAMMSGSVVGTPVHMAPELMTGHYDSSVDVYAFGILFWYICAGHTSLPDAFDQFFNKEQLWTSVRRGVRPERLPKFSDECWNLMNQCWAGNPSKRPLLGAILPVLESIREKAEGKFKKGSLKDERNRALSLLEPKNQKGQILEFRPVDSILTVFSNFARAASCLAILPRKPLFKLK